MVLLSGTSNKPLAEAIAKQLRVRMGDLEITRFIDNECRVQVREQIEGNSVYVIQSLSEIADQNLVELCLIGHAVKQLKAIKVTAVIPWMGYSKQDKAFQKGEAVSAHLVAKFIESAGFDSVITCELHSENIIPFFRIPIYELMAFDLLSEYAKDTKNTVVISPDKGGKSRSEKFASHVGLPIVYLSKKRGDDGEAMITDISDSVQGKDIIIFDDIINTGSTAIVSSRYLKGKGAGNIEFLATHAVLAGDAHKKLEESDIDSVVVTDTILIPDEKKFDKLTVVSVAPLFAEKIKIITREL